VLVALVTGEQHHLEQVPEDLPQDLVAQVEALGFLLVEMHFLLVDHPQVAKAMLDCLL